MDRPKPPPPLPPSEPTIRSARAPMPSSPESRNWSLLTDAVKKLNEEKAEQANLNKAFISYAAKIADALGVDEEPDGQSDPPPATTRRRKPKKKLDTIELDSLKAKYGVYLFFLMWAADKVLEHFHLFGAK